jgi:endonuclease-3
MRGSVSPRHLLEAMAADVGDTGIPSPLAAGRDPFCVLVGTVISLRTRDLVTEVVTKRVLESVPSVEAMAAVSVEKLAGLLRPAGFFNRKAVQLKKTAEVIIRDYKGKVPQNRVVLEALPGVGGKTAAYVQSMAFGIPAICVDVHVHRISNRLGIVETNSPDQTERALMTYFPIDLWIPLNHVFVKFGQKKCLPRNPQCSSCCFESWCRYAD